MELGESKQLFINCSWSKVSISEEMVKSHVVESNEGNKIDYSAQ